MTFAVTFPNSPETITMVAAVLLSLLFSYVPGFASWYNGIEKPQYKQLIMLGLLIVVTGAVFGLSCAQIIGGVECTREGAIAVVWSFVLSVVANQATHAISPKVGLKTSAPARG